MAFAALKPTHGQYISCTETFGKDDADTAIENAQIRQQRGALALTKRQEPIPDIQREYDDALNSSIHPPFRIWTSTAPPDPDRSAADIVHNVIDINSTSSLSGAEMLLFQDPQYVSLITEISIRIQVTATHTSAESNDINSAHPIYELIQNELNQGGNGFFVSSHCCPSVPIDSAISHSLELTEEQWCAAYNQWVEAMIYVMRSRSIQHREHQIRCGGKRKAIGEASHLPPVHLDLRGDHPLWRCYSVVLYDPRGGVLFHSTPPSNRDGSRHMESSELDPRRRPVFTLICIPSTAMALVDRLKKARHGIAEAFQTAPPVDMDDEDSAVRDDGRVGIGSKHEGSPSVTILEYDLWEHSSSWTFTGTQSPSRFLYLYCHTHEASHSLMQCLLDLPYLPYEHGRRLQTYLPVFHTMQPIPGGVFVPVHVSIPLRFATTMQPSSHSLPEVGVLLRMMPSLELGTAFRTDDRACEWRESPTADLRKECTAQNFATSASSSSFASAYLHFDTHSRMVCFPSYFVWHLMRNIICAFLRLQEVPRGPKMNKRPRPEFYPQLHREESNENEGEVHHTEPDALSDSLQKWSRILFTFSHPPLLEVGSTLSVKKSASTYLITQAIATASPRTSAHSKGPPLPPVRWSGVALGFCSGSLNSVELVYEPIFI